MIGRRKLVGAGSLVMAALALGFGAANLHAYSDGVSGKAQSAQGCSCHSTSPNANGAVTVSISGPQGVQPGATASYTISVAGGPSGTTGGFDLAKTGGTWVPGANTQVLGSDLTHSVGTQRTWSFQWTAPATAGTYSLYAVAMSTNGGGTSGDSWNWYGGAVNTAFTITVSSQVGADGATASGLWLAPAAPNPTSGPTRIEFSLAEPGPVRLEIFNVAGRRVVLLASGELTAGRHVQSWDGRDEAGRLVPSGQYFVRLRAGSAGRSRGFFVLH